MKEIWKSVVNFEDRYEISNLGNLKSVIFKKHKILKGAVQKNGYRTYQLKSSDGKTVTKGEHVLVAEAFIPNPENKPTVDHINENKLDNSVENLRWATYSEQRQNISNLKPTRRERFTEHTIDLIIIMRHYLELSYVEIARYFDCSPISIGYIFQGKTYSSYTGIKEVQ